MVGVVDYPYWSYDAGKDPQDDSDTDEIASIARKVLEDLESFVDENGANENTERDGGAGNDDHKPIGVSLEELQLILDTSIRRHDGRIHRMKTRPQVRKVEHAPIAPAPEASDLLPTNTRRVRASRVLGQHERDTQATSSVLELTQLLESKRQAFAQVQEDNRQLGRSWFPQNRHRDRRSDDGSISSMNVSVGRLSPRHRPHAQPDRATAEGYGRRASLASLEPVDRSRSSSATQWGCQSDRHELQLEGLLVPREGSTTTRSPIPIEQHTTSIKAEKACNVTPSELGPATSDLPHFLQPPTSVASGHIGDEQPPGTRLREFRREEARPPSSESSWSSSCLVSSSSSSGSSRSTTHKRSHSTRSNNRNNDKQSSHSDTGASRLGTTQFNANTERLIPLIRSKTALPSQHEQLEWELDLSNFNI